MCTFSRYPGRHATDVRVKMFKGIAAVIGNLIVNSVTYDVLVWKGVLRGGCTPIA